jgi:hypothetical protein
MAQAILVVVPSVAQTVVKVGLLNSYTGFVAQTAPGDLLTN